MTVRTNKIRNVPPPGKKLIRDWLGMRVRTKEAMRNGYVEIPAGSLATVDGIGVGLELKVDPCQCCGMKAIISRVHGSKVEPIGEAETIAFVRDVFASHPNLPVADDAAVAPPANMPTPIWWINHGTHGQITTRADEAERARNVGATIYGYRADHAAVTSVAAAPIPMLLFCPACGLQHIDAPEPARDGEKAWDNPPHRSHKCHACATVWRPADVPTVGVASIQTTGQADNWDRSVHTVAAGAVRSVTMAEVEKSLLRKLLSFAWKLDIMWHRDRHEIRRIKLDVRDGVSMAPRLVEQRVDLIREFVATGRNAFSPGGGADGETVTPDQSTEAAR